MPAMITPTNAAGAPMCNTAASRLGASFFASSTTAARHINKRSELKAVTALLGCAACCVDFPASSSERKYCRWPMVCVKTNVP